MKRLGLTASLLLGAAALTAAVPSGAQNQNSALVIQGATLVDGNGGAPVANSVIVVTGNRITAVGRVGQVRVPAGAITIDARGKWVIPGLVDAKSNYASNMGEAYLVWGVTSAVASGEGGDVGQADRDAINHGIYPGPRLYLSYAGLNGPGVDGKRPDGTVPGRPGYVVHTPEESRMRMQQFLSAGADMLYVGEGTGSPELLAPAVEEAHKAGKSAVLRTVGPVTRARAAAMIGADVLVHTGEAGVELAKDQAKWKDYIDLPPDPYSDMDEAKVPDLIKLLVDHHVALEPDLIATGRGFPKNWKRVQEEDSHFFEDANLRAYYPAVQIKGVIENVKSPDTYLTPAQLDVRARGFKNQVDFLHRFVQAGGHLVTASDIPQSPPGFGVLQEMAVFQEDVGLTPMQVLQAATKWGADAFKLQGVGTIAQGNFADMVILNADPTQDILNVRKIDSVIKDGKIVDRTYHADYGGMQYFKSSVFPSGLCCFTNPTIESQAWLAALKQTTWRPDSRNGGFQGIGGLDSENTPTPGIEGIMPYTIIQGAPTTTVTITGFNFVRGSQVLLDGKPVPAKIVSRTEIQATVDAAILAKPKKYALTVKNPGPVTTPEWGDTSNQANLLVPFSFTTQWSQNKF